MSRHFLKLTPEAINLIQEMHLNGYKLWEIKEELKTRFNIDITLQAISRQTKYGQKKGVIKALQHNEGESIQSYYERKTKDIISFENKFLTEICDNYENLDLEDKLAIYKATEKERMLINNIVNEKTKKNSKIIIDKLLLQNFNLSEMSLEEKKQLKTNILKQIEGNFNGSKNIN